MSCVSLFSYHRSRKLSLKLSKEITMTRILSILLFSLVLSACVSPPVELNRSTFDSRKIESIRLMDRDAKIQYQRSDSSTAAATAGAGLLGALVGSAIDAGVNTKRSKSLAPLLGAMADYNPNLYLKSALENEATGVAFQHPVKVTTGSMTEGKLIPRVIPSYTIAPGFDNVYVSLSVSVEQLIDNEKDYQSLYTGNAFNDREGTDEEKRQNWIDSPHKLIAKLQSAISDAVQRFVADFNGDAYIEAEPAVGEYPVHALPLKYTAADDSSETVGSQQGRPSIMGSAYPALVEQLNSADTMTMRAAAIQVGQNKSYDDEGIIAACISVLEKNLASGVGIKDKYLIDGLAWCALNLGNAGSMESKPVLGRISASDLPRKLRKHAMHALKQINGGN